MRPNVFAYSAFSSPALLSLSFPLPPSVPSPLITLFRSPSPLYPLSPSLPPSPLPSLVTPLPYSLSPLPLSPPFLSDPTPISLPISLFPSPPLLTHLSTFILLPPFPSSFLPPPSSLIITLPSSFTFLSPSPPSSPPLSQKIVVCARLPPYSTYTTGRMMYRRVLFSAHRKEEIQQCVEKYVVAYGSLDSLCVTASC